MRRFQLGLSLLAVPVLACTLFVAGCSKDDKKDTGSSSNTGPDKDPTKSAELKPMSAKNGHIKGEVRLKGKVSDLEQRTKDLLAQIDKKGEDKEKCLMGQDSEKTEQTYRISSDGNKVGNVFVWIAPEKDSYFKIEDKQIEEAKKHPVMLHQPHCAFIPHCAVLFTKYVPDPKKPRDLKSTGQVLHIKNDAKMTHNTKWAGPPQNAERNETLPVDKDLTVDNLVPSKSEVRFSCTIHPWMDGYMRVFDHPYATLTLSDTLDGDNKVKPDDPKFGTFELKNLPVGNVRIFAWHEAAGFLNKGKGNGEPIQIKEGEPLTVTFELEAK